MLQLFLCMSASPLRVLVLALSPPHVSTTLPPSPHSKSPLHKVKVQVELNYSFVLILVLLFEGISDFCVLKILLIVNACKSNNENVNNYIMH